MTGNQIRYAEYVEGKRHNQATEAETYRSNRANEIETNRHNVVTETETNRHNVTTEQELNRHNLATEAIGRTQAYASVLSAQAAQTQAQAAVRNAATNELNAFNNITKTGLYRQEVAANNYDTYFNKKMQAGAQAIKAWTYDDESSSRKFANYAGGFSGIIGGIGKLITAGGGLFG